MSLTPELREYALEKIGTIERFFKDSDPDAVIVDIELGKTTQHHRKGDIWFCEVNVTVGKKLLRAEETAETVIEAVDVVRDEIQRDVKKWQDKKRTKFMRGARKAARQLKRFKFRK